MPISVGLMGTRNVDGLVNGRKIDSLAQTGSFVWLQDSPTQ